MKRKRCILVKTVLIVGIALILFAVTSCETIVEVDLPEYKPVLVANSLFNPDNQWEVKLYNSKSSLARYPTSAVFDATVEIVDNGSVVASLTHRGNGIYRSSSNQTPSVGGSYVLRASASGYDPIEATDFVPVPVEVGSVDVDARSNSYKLTVHFSDPDENKNYYQILVVSPDVNGSGELYPVWFESDDLLFQDLDGANPESALFDDSLISGKNYSLKLRAYPHHTEPPFQMYVVLLSVTESYYNYMKSTKNQVDNGENPFSSPVQVYNNIENGLGIFAGYSASIFAVF